MEFHILLRQKPVPRPVSSVALRGEASQAGPPMRPWSRPSERLDSRPETLALGEEP
jgi:hypothetical protein